MKTRMSPRTSRDGRSPQDIVPKVALNAQRPLSETALDTKIEKIDKRKCGVLVNSLKSQETPTEQKLGALRELIVIFIALNHDELTLIARVLQWVKTLSFNHDPELLKEIETAITAAEILAINVGGFYTPYDRHGSLT